MGSTEKQSVPIVSVQPPPGYEEAGPPVVTQVSSTDPQSTGNGPSASHPGGAAAVPQSLQGRTAGQSKYFAERSAGYEQEPQQVVVQGTRQVRTAESTTVRSVRERRLRVGDTCPYCRVSLVLIIFLRLFCLQQIKILRKGTIG